MLVHLRGTRGGEHLCYGEASHAAAARVLAAEEVGLPAHARALLRFVLQLQRNQLAQP